MKRILAWVGRRRPSPAMLVALTALSVALGGTGYAATQLARNSVGPSQIRANAVGSSEIRAGAVGTSEIRDRTVRANDLAAGVAVSGPQGPQGPPGPSTGPAGGDLAGSYPNPTLRPGSVGPATFGSMPAVRVQSTADQSIASSGASSFTDFRAATFPTEVYDTDDMYVTTQDDRITIRTAGVYALSGAVRWEPNALGVRTIGIVPNDGDLGFLAASTTDAAGSSSATRQNVSTVARLDAGTVVRLMVAQSSSSTLQLNDAGSPQIHLSATWQAPDTGDRPTFDAP